MDSAEILATVTLRAGFNSAVVVAGTACLGVAAGVIGSFMLLRKRAMVSDALSHATLPGIALAFLTATALGMEGRNLPVLLAGALFSGVLGVLAIQALSRFTRLPEDAAIGAVLSVFFGVGVVLLSHIQTLATGNQAGLKTFILGQTAAMNRNEAMAIAGLALAALTACVLLFKEFRLLCFDPGFAAGQGWPIVRIDLTLMGLTTLVTVIGLQTVGLILIIALLIVPPAAARFWTEKLWAMLVIAAVLGGVSGWLGASLSALVPRLPAGAVIVLVTGVMFLLVILGIGILYRYGPNVKTPRTPIFTWGAVFAAFLWAVASVAFSAYLSSFNSYNRIYGSIGTVVALLMWFYLAGFSVLLGALINVELARRRRVRAAREARASLVADVKKAAE